MTYSAKTFLAITALILALTACAAPQPTSTPLPIPTDTPAITPTGTAHQCPQATQEWLAVEPIPAATDQLSITVNALPTLFDQIQVKTESGTFTSDGGPVTVTLLPNTAHHLEVTARVPLTAFNNCTYGGYSLTTTTDRNGNPLVVEQVSSLTPTPCPQGTAEPFWVDPIPATTDQLTLTVVVHVGNGKEVTVVTEPGAFTVPYDTGQVRVTLLPNAVHHLEVRALIERPECMGGDYTLATTTDWEGKPLVIEQKSP